MSSSQPQYECGEQEKANYYYGLAGTPRLVARTSETRWSQPQHIDGWDDKTFQIPKRFKPVVREDIVNKWTENVSSLLIEVLKPAHWHYFFPINIGLERVQEPLAAYSREFETILLVTVEPASLEWKDGFQLAQKCLHVLRGCGIMGVHVEIKEGRYQRLAASERLESQCVHEFSGTNEAIMPMTSFLGYPVTQLGEDGKQGSVGIHLRLGAADQSPIYALTCRHVVRADEAHQDTYRATGKSLEVCVQGTDEIFSDCLHRVKSLDEYLEQRTRYVQDKKDRWEYFYPHDGSSDHKRFSENDEKHLCHLQGEMAYNKEMIRSLEACKEKKDRVIGHLAFHPSFEASSQQPQYLKDWALIELDSRKYPNGPQNKVYVADGNEPVRRVFERLENGFLELKDMERGLNLKGAKVGKRGFQTGVTCGTVNGIDAVIRHHRTDGATVVTRELLIVPEGQSLRFSSKGDSGSAVFGWTVGSGSTVGLVGMVVGSTGDDPKTWMESPPKDHLKDQLAGTDVTFASPMDWILKDIEDFTGLEPRLV